MKNEDPLEDYNLFISRLSLEEIRNLTDEEIRGLSMVRPGHPGQYGFLLSPVYFRLQEHFEEMMCALLDRLGKV